METIRIGISTCLLGEPVRYDGGHKLDRFLRDTLGGYVEYVPVCPEVECGLPVPRESMHLEGDPGAPRLITTRTRRGYDRQNGRMGRQAVVRGTGRVKTSAGLFSRAIPRAAGWNG